MAIDRSVERYPRVRLFCTFVCFTSVRQNDLVLLRAIRVQNLRFVKNCANEAHSQWERVTIPPTNRNVNSDARYRNTIYQWNSRANHDRSPFRRSQDFMTRHKRKLRPAFHNLTLSRKHKLTKHSPLFLEQSTGQFACGLGQSCGVIFCVGRLVEL